jgi:hypothetical protein
MLLPSGEKRGAWSDTGPLVNCVFRPLAEVVQVQMRDCVALVRYAMRVESAPTSR